MKLKDKVAIVTGASGGIGKAITLHLAAAGAAVICNYCTNQQKAEAVVQAAREAGGSAVSMQGDVRSFAEMGTMTASVIAQFGRIDILVNNAGITRDELLLSMSDKAGRMS